MSSGTRKPTILSLCDYYLPAYKAGGPPRSVANIVEQLSDEFAFRVVARDRDLGDSAPFSHCRRGTWQTVGKAEVLYLSPQRLHLQEFRRILAQTEYDVLYLNSFFAFRFAILPLTLRRLGLVPPRPLVLAPRGQFSTGAIQLKKTKKWAFLQAARIGGLYRDVLWQASSDYEKEDILRVFGRNASVFVAPNLRGPAQGEPFPEGLRSKAPGSLRAAFLSRISPKKNLDVALRMVASLKGRVEFHIYGPKEDPDYWNDCVRLIRNMPPNVQVTDHGAIRPEEVPAALRQHHLFFFPTRGENFGFVILDALLAGCPVLLSDQTPWRQLQEKGAGWDLPLEPRAPMQQVLQRCVEMDDEAFQRLSRSARHYGQAVASDGQAADANRVLFHCAAQQRLTRSAA
jgi:glycosyltransferase involved in cell wall biosynthesis